LTAIEKPLHSAVIALGRSILFPVSFLVLLFHFTPSPLANEGNDINISFLVALPAAEWVTFLLAVVLVYKHYYLKNTHM
jgi:hypothetical protein